ncbi:hypothetical protein BH18VER1_BH18VER1_22840 [soil metagenome]
MRQAERQRDAINAKQERIAQLERSINAYDRTANEIRGRGGDASFWQKESEALLREKWKLQP